MFNFGIPKSRASKKEEMYSFPVLFLKARSGEDDNTSYKFEFNTAGLLDLQLSGGTEHVAFSFEDSSIIIKNVTVLNLPHNIARRVTRTGTFSSKPYYMHIIKKEELDMLQINAFKLVKAETETGGMFFILEKLPSVGDPAAIMAAGEAVLGSTITEPISSESLEAFTDSASTNSVTTLDSSTINGEDVEMGTRGSF